MLITVQPQAVGSRVALRFPYNQALVEAFKEMPGVQWDVRHKFWTCPKSALPVVAEHIEQGFAGVQWRFTGPLYPGGLTTISSAMQTTLRPYQIDAVQRFLSVPGYLLTFEPRVGKTSCVAAAIGSAFMQNLIDVALIIYPAGVSDEWKRQLPQFTGGLHPYMLSGHTPLTATEITYLRNTRHLVIGVHWEILAKRVKCIQQVIGDRRYSAAADEIHRLRNRKSKQTLAAFELAHAKNCVYRWALTGTPMRNRPRDLWPTFNFIEKDSMGGYWTYVKRFSGAVEREHGWDDKGTAKEHMPELAARLAAVSYRLTRQDVAPWLPKGDDKMILCSMDGKTQAFYSAQERAFAPELQKALGDHSDHIPAGSIDALKRLALTVANVKIPVLCERVDFHCGERQVKTLIFANWHEPLLAAEAALGLMAAADLCDDQASPYFGQPNIPIYCAGGWLSPEKRKQAITAWKVDPRPGVLLCNTLSSGIGIDLSAAEVTIFLELSWVPADFLQTKARTENIHLADARSAPPLCEYLLVKNTVDQDMAMGMITKFTAIEQIVGTDQSSTKTNEMLRSTGLVERGALGLRNEDPETVNAALHTLRARLLGVPNASQARTDSNVALAVDVAEAFDEGEEEGAQVPD